MLIVGRQLCWEPGGKGEHTNTTPRKAGLLHVCTRGGQHKTAGRKLAHQWPHKTIGTALSNTKSEIRRRGR